MSIKLIKTEADKDTKKEKENRKGERWKFLQYARWADSELFTVKFLTETDLLEQIGSQ